MRRFFCTVGVACGLLAVAAPWPARADVLDYLWGHSGPPTLADVAKMIDHIQHSLTNQGTVVIKQPDVWSQARMTQFRQEYEDTMAAQLTKFDARLAGRIARSDTANFVSQTALAASISPLGANLSTQLTTPEALKDERERAVKVLTGAADWNSSGSIALTAPTNSRAAFDYLKGAAPVGGTDNTGAAMAFGLEPNVDLDQRSDYITHLHRLRRINLGDDNADSAGYGLYLMRIPLSIQPGSHTKKGFGAIVNLTVSHDFNPRFLQSTYRNLVINDLVDKLSPVVHELIRSGAAASYEKQKEKIDKDFEARRNDPSAPPSPIVEELEAIAKRTGEITFAVNRAGARLNAIAPGDMTNVFQLQNLLTLAAESQRALGVLATSAEGLAARATVPTARRELEGLKAQYQLAEAERQASIADHQLASNAAERETRRAEAVARDINAEAIRKTRMAEAGRSAGVTPSSVGDGVAAVIPQTSVLIPETESPIEAEARSQVAAEFREADEKAEEAERAEDRMRQSAKRAEVAAAKVKVAEGDLQKALDAHDLETKPYRNRVRLIDVRSYLRNQLEAAYDLVDGHGREGMPVLQSVDYVESLVNDFYNRRLDEPQAVGDETKPKEQVGKYEVFLSQLPGGQRDEGLGLKNAGLGALAWGIVLEAGLLNRHLQEEMKRTKGANDYSAPPDIDMMYFYAPEPPEATIRAFEDYVRARWPMIAFSLEPVVDQQNIEDAFTRRRDLQLAVAFALASGRISFRQAMTFTRNLQYEAQTIALNQTVAAFANGNDTFGWRITPRYQTPPEESNFQAMSNLIFRGGPGPNWQLSNSKIEPGLRELTAVVVMPSFVQGVRVDTSGDWFRLADPGSRKLHTARTVELGRRINEARECLEEACKHANYRPEDVERLRVRLRQLESMLPLQTAFVRVPYENTLGGFALFSQGKTDLVPELVGFDGLDYIDPGKPTDLIIHGRNFSLYETSVVVGGKNLSREGTRSYVVWDKEGKPFTLSSLTNPIRNEKGELVLQVLGDKGAVTTIMIPDPGSYLIQSREVMRVRIPAGVARVARADGTEAVEVNVSTPTGISNRLLIPIRPETSTKQTKPEPKPTPVVGLAATATIVDPVVTFRYRATIDKDGKLERKDRIGVDHGTTVRVLSSVPQSAKETARARLEFPVGAPKATVLSAIEIADVPLDPTNNCYVLDEAKLNDIAAQIEAMIAGSKLAPGPDSTFTTSRVSLWIPSMEPKRWMKTTNNLTVNYEFVVSQAPAVASPAAGAALSSTPASRRDDQMLKASDERIVIPPPSRPLDLDALPALPRSQPWDIEEAAGEPFEIDDEDALAPPTRFERSAPRIAFQEGAEEPAPSATDLGVPAPTPTTIPPPSPPSPSTSSDDRPAAVVVPVPGGSQTVVVAPQPPSVNVSVPINNIAKPPRRGLFHRDREPATPQNPARRSLLQRAINGP